MRHVCGLQAGQDWVIVSIFFLEMIAGVVMAIIVGLLLFFRGPELRQVSLGVTFTVVRQSGLIREREKRRGGGRMVHAFFLFYQGDVPYVRRSETFVCSFFWQHVDRRQP